MYKLAILSALLLSACSNVPVNAPMCDEIASEQQKTTPTECRNYVEADAQKATDKTKIKIENKNNIIKFSKDNHEKED